MFLVPGMGASQESGMLLNILQKSIVQDTTPQQRTIQSHIWEILLPPKAKPCC